MAEVYYTSFSHVYNSFFAKITDDMYMQFTQEETAKMLEDLLLTAVHKFEFPRHTLLFQLDQHEETDKQGNTYKVGAFKGKLTYEEINILATYMIVEWIGQQLASIENTRMKYSGSDFKFTSQANHMQKLLQIKKDYQREGFHLQRLYKRRLRDVNGIYRSTFGQIMEPVPDYSVVTGKDGIDNYPDGTGGEWIATALYWNPYTETEDSQP